MSKLMETEKELKEYGELVTKCQVMEQKLEEAHSEKEKLVAKVNALVAKVNALEDRVLTQPSLVDDDKKVLYY